MFSRLKKDKAGAPRTQAFGQSPGFSHRGRNSLTPIEKRRCLMSSITRAVLLFVLLLPGAVKSIAQSQIPIREYPTVPCEVEK
jgi:hypothetical protein